jgi:mono/diheme cytochrome c family protein
MRQVHILQGRRSHRLLVLVLVSISASARAHAEGKATYDRLCASCHGADGRGNVEKAKALKIDPELLDLGRPAVAGLTRDQLRSILLEGKDKMPAYEQKLKPAEVDPVLDYAIELARNTRGQR